MIRSRVPTGRIQSTPGAFLTSGSSGDIYSFSSTNTFVLNFSVSRAAAWSNGAGDVVFQTETAGAELDYSSVALCYSSCGGAQTAFAVRNELYRDTENTGFGPSSDVVSEWEWPYLPAGVTNFSIVFNGSGTSVALERVMLDVAPAAVAAGSFSLQSAPAHLARWMYPFNQEPVDRPAAPVFAAFGYAGEFDTRDGQYLIGWGTSNNIPAGQGPENYLISAARVTLTVSADMQYVYDGAPRDYRAYFPTNDPRYLPPADPGGPVELYGAGFRGGWTNASGVYTPWTALNYQQDGPYEVDPNGGDYTNRVAFAACFDTNGALVDVSNNVGDDGTNEIANAFEVAPFALGATTNVAPGALMPAGGQITFELNLSDPLIYSYLQHGLNQGNLSFIASSLVNANYLAGSPNWPEFYTVFSPLAGTNQYPLLSLAGTVVRPCLDTDGDGLPDDWERFYFGALGTGATNSADGDGVSNLAKYVEGANPANAATDLRLLFVSQHGNATEMRFSFAPSRRYNIQWSDDLKTWQTVPGPALAYSSAWLAKTGTNLVYPSPAYAVWRDTNATAQQRFYRVQVQ
jgi:hypothetical protein